MQSKIIVWLTDFFIFLIDLFDLLKNKKCVKKQMSFVKSKGCLLKTFIERGCGWFKKCHGHFRLEMKVDESVRKSWDVFRKENEFTEQAVDSSPWHYIIIRVARRIREDWEKRDVLLRATDRVPVVPLMECGLPCV